MTATVTKRTRLYDGDTFTYRGHTFTVTFPPDETMREPWKEHDGHGPVSDWRPLESKRAGERVLHTDHGRALFYDVAAATKLAKADGWGPGDDRRSGETLRAYRARAVEADFLHLQRWCHDDWQWIGVVVKLDDPDDDRDEGDSIWGIESMADEYLTEVAYQCADAIIARIEVETPDVQVSEN